MRAILIAVLGLSGPLMLTGVPAWAAAPEDAPRPPPRVLAAAPVVPSALAAPVRPGARPAPPAAPEAPVPVQSSSRDAGLQRWIAGFRGRALSAGIGADVFDRAFRGVRHDPGIVRRDRNQAEFTQPIWKYLDAAVSESRVRNGRAALRRHADRLQAIEDSYGVEKEVVAAIWGMESAYGTRRGDLPVIQSLANLAYDGRRGRFFERQLLAALRILQAGDVAPERMTGSWAGAMGHTQFIPTSFLEFAVDATGDGRRDIWGDDPADALASTAAYLKRSGWRKGQPWGVEVRLAEGFDYAQADRSTRRLPSRWARAGVVGMDGRAVPDHGNASILLPAGARGAAFLVFDNFAAIERYNAADAYVIGVGHLSDRLGGAGPIRADWPRGDRPLTSAERRELQRRLSARGFDTGGVDGRIGPRSVAALRAFQRSAGMPPDGYASLDVLERLR